MRAYAFLTENSVNSYGTSIKAINTLKRWALTNNPLYNGTCTAPALCGSPDREAGLGFCSHRPVCSVVAFMAFLKVRKVKNLHSKNSWQSWSLQVLCNKPITTLLNLYTSDKYIVNAYPKVKKCKKFRLWLCQTFYWTNSSFFFFFFNLDRTRKYWIFFLSSYTMKKYFQSLYFIK